MLLQFSELLFKFYKVLLELSELLFKFYEVFLIFYEMFLELNEVFQEYRMWNPNSQLEAKNVALNK